MANPTTRVTLNGQFFQMFAPYTRVIGRFLDVVSYDLNVTKSTGFATFLAGKVEN